MRYSFFSILLIILSHTSFSQTNISAKENNQSVKVIKGSKPAKLIKNDNPIIVEQGKNIELDIHEQNQGSATVRLHSSLGRLVRTFRDVKDKFSLNTTKLLPGIYMLIIKQSERREIRKLLVTEKG